MAGCAGGRLYFVRSSVYEFVWIKVSDCFVCDVCVCVCFLKGRTGAFVR